MKDFRSLIISFLIIGLFFFCFVSFAYHIQIDNNANRTILDDSQMNSTLGWITSNITESEDKALAQRNSTEAEVVEAPEGAFILKSIVSGGISFISMFVGIYNVTIGFIFKAIGIDTIIFQTLTSIIIITIVFLFWRLVKVGE